ncbi:MAG: hypothetical protein PHD72_04285 [Patescibacteria group bacterium]|nr:hypothetical protein [Patescibacteria group bacterium]
MHSRSNNKRQRGWGTCAECGVVPLLYKLHKGILLGKPAEIRKVKKFLKI